MRALVVVAALLALHAGAGAADAGEGRPRRLSSRRAAYRRRASRVVGGSPIPAQQAAPCPAPNTHPWTTKHYDGTSCGFCDDRQRISLPRGLVDSVNEHTLVGQSRRECTIDLAVCTITEGIEGDFFETGVFKGGTATLMKQVIDSCLDGAAQPRKKAIWLADSWEGLPAPMGRVDRKFTNKGPKLRTRTAPDKIKKGNYKASFENFLREYGEMAFADKAAGAAFAGGDRSQAKIVKGWFNDTLPTVGVGPISFLRLDGDVYSSTRDGLQYLYPKLVEGGYLYLDDYGSFAGCQRATDEYRKLHNITSPMHHVGEGTKGISEEAVARGVEWPAEAVWWKKGSDL